MLKPLRETAGLVASRTSHNRTGPVKPTHPNPEPKQAKQAAVQGKGEPLALHTTRRDVPLSWTLRHWRPSTRPAPSRGRTSSGGPRRHHTTPSRHRSPRGPGRRQRRHQSRLCHHSGVSTAGTHTPMASHAHSHSLVTCISTPRIPSYFICEAPAGRKLNQASHDDIGVLGCID